MADEKYSQAGNRLIINTVFDGHTGANESDPLLLVAVDGDEHVSQPFKYTLTVWRDQKLEHIVPEQIINTQLFGILVSEYTGQPSHTTSQGTVRETAALTKKGYAYRCGIVGNFTYDGVVGARSDGVVGPLGAASAPDNRFFQYKLIIVPQFQMLQYETCFRLFEDKTFLEIIDEFKKKRFLQIC